MNKIILNREAIKQIRQKLKAEGKKVVFTNGCFDILHSGHVDYLSKAKKCGDVLIVALNSDISVKNIKDNRRPILSLNERAFIIYNLKAVNYVTYFDENTPEEIIKDLLPDVLVKGEDWEIDKIVGREVVEANGGEVKRIHFINNQSTSKIINTIIERYKEKS